MLKRYVRGFGVLVVAATWLTACGDASSDSSDEPINSSGGDGGNSSEKDSGKPSPTTEKPTTDEPTTGPTESSSGDEDASTEPTAVDASTTPTSGSDSGTDSGTETSAASMDGGADASTDGGLAATGGVTYFQDVMPLFVKQCGQCHQPGGIGPFDITDYDTAKIYASEIKEETESRGMPPNLVTNDGSCGSFTSAWLSDEELASIAAWVDGGAKEGKPVDVEVPDLPVLDGAVETLTPEYSPVAGGGDLDLNDEYRCFVSDYTTEDLKFITGFQVIPGNDKIVHHVLGFVVDTTADSDIEGKTNAEVMDDLHAASSDREGWPCFGMAGDGIKVEAVPVSWAPGQGVVTYPDDSGVPMTATRRLVLQVHYNLADPDTAGMMDQTTVQLQIKDPADVENVGVFLLKDPLLGTLYDETPTTLPPGQESTLYTWERTFVELGFPDYPISFNLYGVSPHMHGLGHRYTFELLPEGDAGSPICGAQVDEWDFHWQHTYFYEQPITVHPHDSVRVTCDYDTTSKTEPVMPGWGTRNEMCLGNFFVTVPKQLLGL
jgi:mono/diheme cytochrome c family protein